jgi:hypothetical protein
MSNLYNYSIDSDRSNAELEKEKIQNCVMIYMGVKAILIWDANALKEFNSLPFKDFIKDQSNGIQRIVIMNCDYNVSVAKFLEDCGNADDDLYNILYATLKETILTSIKAQEAALALSKTKDEQMDASQEDANAIISTANAADSSYSPAELAAAETPIDASSKGIVVLGVQLPGCSLGDYSHMHDILPLIFDKFPQCAIHVFIGIDHNHPYLQLLHEKIKRDFFDRKIECVVYTIFYTDEVGSYTANKEVTKYIEKLIKSDRFLAAFNVSYPCKEISVACVNQKKVEIRIFAHAVPMFEDQFPIININMGLDKGRFGVKLPKVIADDNLEARANILIMLGTSEPDFFRMLTGSVFSGTDYSGNLAAAKLYLETHRYMYGFVQGNTDTILFIVAHVLKYLTNNNALDKPCDFHIPKLTSELENLIRYALIKYGIDEGAIEFLNQTSQQSYVVNNQSSASAGKIRIFTYKIKDDEVWKLLYQVSKDGAGSSGDNSTELAYGSRSVPLIVTISDDRKCWVMSLIKIANSLPLTTPTLINYFSFLLKYACKPPGFLSELPYENEGVTIFEVAQGIAGFLRDPNLQKEWEYLRQELLSNPRNNFYNNLGLLLCPITYSSSYSDYLVAKTKVKIGL